MNADPKPQAGAIATEFLELVSGEEETLIVRFAYQREFPAELYEVVGVHGERWWAPDQRQHQVDSRVERIHLEKVNPDLTDRRAEY